MYIKSIIYIYIQISIYLRTISHYNPYHYVAIDHDYCNYLPPLICQKNSQQLSKIAAHTTTYNSNTHCTD